MRETGRLGRILPAFYVWSLAMFLGCILLDVVYAGLLEGSGGLPSNESVYAEVSDFLLIPGGLALFLAFGAIASSWNVPRARTLFLASGVLLLMEFVPPTVLLPSLRGSPGSPGPPDIRLGPVLRLVPVALSSLLALAGFFDLFREKPDSDRR